MSPLTLTALGCGALALATLALAVAALRRRHLLGSAIGLLSGLLLLCLVGLFATIGVATQGYRALTHEEVALRASIEPIGPQRFLATLTFTDGSQRSYALDGDQLYVDAHILKWTPLANLVGLHTAYELDRVGGRYLDLDDERGRPRSLFSLKRDKPLDMFGLRQRHGWLAPLLDTEYGSATFVRVERREDFEVRVSTTGLLIRPAPYADARGDR